MAWEGILQALWLFLPAYVANMGPVFVAKLVPAWGAPIDGGRVGSDGNRILGAGKTWRGLAGGALLGGLVAMGCAVSTSYVLPDILAEWDYGRGEGTSLVAIFVFGAVVGFMALVGDAVKSYFKRRRGKQGGAPWFPFDQLDFVVFGLIGFVIAAPLLPAGWVWHHLTDDWVILTTLFLLTPALHLLVNRIGYWMGLKKVPW